MRGGGWRGQRSLGNKDDHKEEGKLAHMNNAIKMHMNMINALIQQIHNSPCVPDCAGHTDLPSWTQVLRKGKRIFELLIKGTSLSFLKHSNINIFLKKFLIKKKVGFLQA